jgi:biopolymer transport protein ExbB
MSFTQRVGALLLLGFCFLGTAWAQGSSNWWNKDWPYRKQITVDASATGANLAGSPENVPILVRLSLANFQYFSNLKPDASDLRAIADDDSTPLKLHIEHFDPQAQIALIWVLVPKVAGGGKTSFYLYYGNENASSASDPAGTYDGNQVLVYHFGPPKGSPQDSTHYKSDPTAFNATVNPASLIGSGASFSGSQTITIPASSTGSLRLAAGQGFTASAWVRFSAAQSSADVVQLSGQGTELTLGISGTQAFARYASGSGAPLSVQATGQLTTGDWHHLALTLGGGQLTLYVDGAQAGQAPAQAVDIAGTLTVGGSAAGGSFFTGDMDELEVSDIARSADWIKAAASSQGMTAPLIVYGTDEQKSSSSSPSYFATTLRNVTADGWVIIAILSVMFIAAVCIMGTKAFYFSRVARANAKFLAEFRKMADDPAALERRVSGKAGSGSEEESSAFEEGTQSQLMSAIESDGSGFGISTLWRLYHHGIRETMKRLPAGQPAGADRVRSLSPQSIEAIRATLDASLTRMTQQLNSQMVWLTVAIAGGPFLGLLGTVIGVMITFAAIAASGDVNVNAIAPGTAAALVATVAGLGVAIPCLFGYNYLNTRMKEIVADMRVFVDELVTRIAETYS